MKTATEWYWELNYEHVTVLDIRAIQVDALKWALSQIVPDGNPENAMERIKAGLMDAAFKIEDGTIRPFRP